MPYRFGRSQNRHPQEGRSLYPSQPHLLTRRCSWLARYHLRQQTRVSCNGSASRSGVPTVSLRPSAWQCVLRGSHGLSCCFLCLPCCLVHLSLSLEALIPREGPPRLFDATFRLIHLSSHRCAPFAVSFLDCS